MSTAIAFPDPPCNCSASDPEKLAARITELCSDICAAEFRLLTLIREFDKREYWAEAGLCSCAHWLNLKCGTGN